MTSTGIFMRRAVPTNASFHCAADSPSTSPDSSAATKTPVPAADSQLMAKRAASGFAFAGATGGTRITWLRRAGMSHTGSDSVPASGEPSSVVFTGTSAKTLLRAFFHAGAPHSAQHSTRITHGSHACTVSLTV